MLANGFGGIDWSGLPIVCAYLGIEDVERLIDGMMAVIAYKPPRKDD